MSRRHPTMNRRTTRVTSSLLGRRAAALKRHLPLALDGDVRGVHQARVASRRLREAVPVLTSGVKGSKAKKALGKIRRLTKSLGTVRELDVTLLILDEMAGDNRYPRPALEDVRGRVIAQREKGRAAMLKRVRSVRIDKLDRRLAAVGEALAATDSVEWKDALASRLIKRAKALAAAMSQAGRLYAPEQLHAVRIAAKKLRYALELAADAGITSAAGPVRVVKRTQETLGRLHDLQVLQRQVASIQAKPNTRSLPSSGLEIITHTLEDECRHLHARYVGAMSQLHETLDAVRSAVVPELARQRPRPLKMGLKRRPVARRAVSRASAAAAGQR
jgi:CHAD domain-containing protein